VPFVRPGIEQDVAPLVVQVDTAVVPVPVAYAEAV